MEKQTSQTATPMKTDIEIAQEAQMLPIWEIAAQLGLTEDDMEQYGKYKAKISLDVYRRLQDKPDGKLILVTAILPTPAGEGGKIAGLF